MNKAVLVFAIFFIPLVLQLSHADILSDCKIYGNCKPAVTTIVNGSGSGNISGITWAEATNGTLALFTDIINWNSTGLIINWSSYLTSSETNWNANYSNFLNVYNTVSNGTFYLNDNPNGYYNFTTLPAQMDISEHWVYTSFNFDVSGQDSTPYGITQNGTYFWIVGSSSGAVYQYWMNGTYTGSSFSVAGQDGSPMGITQNGTYFWVVGYSSQAVYKYYMDGTYTGDSFDVSGTGSQPTGITQNGTYFWITNMASGGVYEYQMDGTYVGSSFSTTGQDSAPFGILQGGNYFWVTGYSSDRVYKYWMNGDYTRNSFDISGQDGHPTGITKDGTYFWVVGVDTQRVYQYTPIGYLTTESDPYWTDNFTKYNATWSSGGGNPFNQVLNTTSNVNFNDVNVTTNLSIQHLICNGNCSIENNAGQNIIYIDGGNKRVLIGDTISRGQYGEVLSLTTPTGSNTNALRINATGGGSGSTAQAFAINQYLPIDALTGRCFTFDAVGEQFSRGVFYSNGVYGIGNGSASRDVFLERSEPYTFKICGDYGCTVGGNLITTGQTNATTFNGLWNGSSNYYLLSNPYNYYNSTTLPLSGNNGTFNSTSGGYVYNDTLYDITFNETKLNQTIDARATGTNLTEVGLYFVNRSDWTTIDNYPTGCGAGTFVTKIGDTLTCVTPTSPSETDPLWTGNKSNYANYSNETSTFVPYTGAIADTDLGLFDLTATALSVYEAHGYTTQFLGSPSQTGNLKYYLPPSMPVVDGYLYVNPMTGELTWRTPSTAVETDPKWSSNLTNGIDRNVTIKSNLTIQNNIMSNGSIASGSYGAVALGNGCLANGTLGTIAIGSNTTASGAWGAIAGGYYSLASGTYGATAFGENATASGSDGATALGILTTASGSIGATAIGALTIASGGWGATAIGYSVNATQDRSFGIGSNFQNAQASSFAVGFNGVDLIVKQGSVNVTNNLIVTNNITDGVNNLTVDKIIDYLVPPMAVMPFAISTCPAGWVMMNGTAYTLVNGTSWTTADLRGRFIIANSSTYPAGNSGGSTSYTPVGTILASVGTVVSNAVANTKLSFSGTTATIIPPYYSLIYCMKT